VHTCGKALASAGAFVCGSAVLREHLINHARTFIFSTAMPPYMAEQIRAALHLAAEMNTERAELNLQSQGLAKSLQRDDWETLGTATQIVPAVIGANDAALAAAEFLQRAGFAVRAMRPPTVPPGTARLRFSVTHKISAAELEKLAAALFTWRAQSHHPIPLALAGSA
jgi:8-amino-7-oxononanoate synthase